MKTSAEPSLLDPQGRISALESRCSTLEEAMKSLLQTNTPPARNDLSVNMDTNKKSHRRQHGTAAATYEPQSYILSGDNKPRYDDLNIYGNPKLQLQSTSYIEGWYSVRSYFWRNRWYRVQGNEDPTWLMHTKEEIVPVFRKHSEVQREGRTRSAKVRS